jgi:hypothetical protein
MIKNILLISLFSVLSACALTDNKSSESLNTSLLNWQNVYNDGEAKIVDNEIHLISTGNWFYLTKKKYSDFIFEADILMPDVTEYSNSGFIFRAQVRPNKKGTAQEAYGYQAEVDPSNRKWSGGLYDQGRRQWLNPLHEKRSNPDADFKENKSPQWTPEKSNAYKHLQWNSYRIVAQGSDIKIYVNNVLTTHVIDVKDSEGYIGIQHHGSKEFKQTGNRKNTIKFRNIRVTEL